MSGDCYPLRDAAGLGLLAGDGDVFGMATLMAPYVTDAETRALLDALALLLAHHANREQLERLALLGAGRGP